MAALLMWQRLGPTARGTAWAEDSGEFLNDRLTLGPVAALWHPYEGYLHLVPRIIVDIAVGAAPIDLYAIVVSALSCCVLGAVCGLVFLLSRPFVSRWPLQVVLAFVPALVPAATIEIAGNTANLHWYLLFLAPWLFAYPARSWWTAAGLAIAAGFVTATEIQAALFLPLLLLQIRNRRVIPIAVTAVAGITAQVVVTLTHPRSTPGGITSVVDVIAGYFAQPVGVSGNAAAPAVGGAIQSVGWWVVVVPGLIVAALLVIALLRAPLLQKWLIAATAIGSVAVWGAALLLNRTEGTNWTSFTSKEWAETGTFRYAAAASMFLLAAIVIAADALIARSPIVWRVTGVVLVVLVLLVGVLNADTPAKRAGGPVWSTQVHNVQQTCAADPAKSMQISALPLLERWRAKVPCALVNAH
ncbi:hypothetical protein [Curtobacterium sp. L1-20]|uniref:hypothetical protein n=1 Tax=Curtobacterium sp. L1-20 TaxID=3138181 RepID=UPI003B51AF90